jgi:hypothetical protein
MQISDNNFFKTINNGFKTIEYINNNNVILFILGINNKLLNIIVNKNNDFFIDSVDTTKQKNLDNDFFVILEKNNNFDSNFFVVLDKNENTLFQFEITTINFNLFLC